MSKHFSSRLAVYLALALVSAVLAAVARRVELAAVAATFLVAITAALLTDRRPTVRFSHQISRQSLFEGDLVEVVFTIHADSPLPVIEVLDPLPAAATLTAGSNTVIASLRRGETRQCNYQMRIDRRSRFTQGRLLHRVHGASGLLFWEAEWAEPKVCVAYPRVEALTRPVRPFHTQVNVGNYPSREAASGLEFASLRQYIAGDQLRTVNWPVSQRTGRLFVNEYTRERNADIVLLIDTFQDAGPFGASVLDRATRAAATLCRHFIGGNNRVGFIELSGIVKWVTPNVGRRQTYRIFEGLADVRARESDVGRDITKLPRQILPAQALIIALTPLIDERFVATLLNLASRRYDVVAVVINPAGVLGSVYGNSLVHETALRVWRMETEHVSAELADIGVPILTLAADEPIELLAARIDALRRRRLMLQ